MLFDLLNVLTIILLKNNTLTGTYLELEHIEIGLNERSNFPCCTHDSI